MPAVTLGFEEIEDRLRMVGRRLNLFNAQHVGYTALSAVGFAGSILIVVALRGTPKVFSATLLVALAVGFSALLITPWLIVRRWRNLLTTAALVDRRAALQDRLATLLAVRDQQPPSRLAGLLMADTLALGRRWEARVVAPRRVPRSVYLFLTALVALGSTRWLSREAPPPNEAMAMAKSASQPAAPHDSLAGAKLDLHPPAAMEPAQADGGDSLPEGAASGAASGKGNAAGNLGARGDDRASSSGIGEPAADGKGAFGEQLQQLIRQAFHAQAMGKPQPLAERDQDRTGGTAERAAGDQRGQSSSAPDQNRRASGDEHDLHNLNDAHGQQGGTSDRNGASEQPNKSGDRSSQSGTGKSGKGSGAGSGSTGSGDLLAAQSGAHGSSAAGGEPKTFKITLVSFLQSSSLKPAPEPKTPHGRIADEGLGDGPRQAATLSDQQLSDDLVRKPEIPPEFEEIVRRVYSQRPES